MNQQLLDLLLCPVCRQPLKLTPMGQNPVVADAQNSPAGAGEILTGLLSCACGQAFPVIAGVPRLIEGGIYNFPEFIKQNREQIQSVCHLAASLPPSESSNGKDDYDNIRKSFSQEWGIFDYDNDKTWGWTLEERKRVFLSDIDMKPEDLTNKLMLDAGCGNGTLTAALSGFGLRIVGMDLNDGLQRAYENRGKYSPSAVANVQYVQGNLMVPPLKESSFDLIYSSGVIHHTPSSQKTFASLAKLTRKNGRLYVWVYGKRGLLVRIFMSTGRGLKCCLSLNSLMTVCRVLAPFYKVAATMLNAIGIMKFRSRTSREITLDLFDCFAPRYNFYHSETEIRQWFEEHGFSNIKISGVQKHGLGMYGDKR